MNFKNIFYSKFLQKWSFLFLMSFVAGLIASHFNAQPNQITIYLVGDSTMSEKEVSAYPETGWGMGFDTYFNDVVKIENHARNGRSTRSFIQEGKWKPIVQNLKEGDFVFIQFGHNDEVQTKSRSTTPDEFQKYLRQYLSETVAKKAQPVLLTPITRRKFDEAGNIKETHKEYSRLMLEVAESEKVPLIDMDKKSQALMNELGPEKSQLIYLHLKAGQNPNYPQGLSDNTHFSETGARMMAELVLQGIKELNLGLEKYFISTVKE
ncbi:MAG: rhamnogalacturonan acetylesterase [Balneolaceae bacterium]